MSLYRLRRGTPCEARRRGGEWRAHVAAADSTFRFHERAPYCDTPHWVFARDGWELRVLVPMLEVQPFDDLAPAPWRVGVTGSREGITPAARAALVRHLREWLMFATAGVPEFHHGGAVGADRAIHNVVREVYGTVSPIVVHPASDLPETLTDWTDANELRPAYPALVRNRRIVDAVSEGSLLLAFPKSRQEEQRSGTWATVRAARKQGVAVLFFWPDGEAGGG